jgi:hypothetical protein
MSINLIACNSAYLEKIPDFVREMSLIRGITFSRNTISTLDNAPGVVDGVFDISSNLLKNLKGDLKIVGSDFYARYNQITSLIGDIKIIDGCMEISDNILFSLDFIPFVSIGIIFRSLLQVHQDNII